MARQTSTHSGDNESDAASCSVTELTQAGNGGCSLIAQGMDTREFRRSCARQNESSKLERKKLVTPPPAALEDPIQKAS